MLNVQALTTSQLRRGEQATTAAPLSNLSLANGKHMAARNGGRASGGLCHMHTTTVLAWLRLVEAAIRLAPDS